MNISSRLDLRPPIKSLTVWISLLLSSLVSSGLNAQTNEGVPQINPTIPELEELELPPSQNGAPEIIIPKQPQNPGTEFFPPATSDRVFVQQIEILGSTVLQPEIEALVANYEGQDVRLDQLFQLRSDLTQLYIDQGYITSGAFLPNNQDFSDGVVRIQVVEGQLEDLEITGLKRLKKSYIRDRILPGTQAPLNQKKLEEKLQLLQLNPLIKRVNAELTAGSAPGLSILLLDLEQAREFHAGVAFDNYRNPAIGSLQGSLDLAHDNVIGYGDRLEASYNVTEGLNLYTLGYTFPINGKDGTLGVSYSDVDSKIVEDDFQSQNITSDYQTLSFNIRQPIIKTPNTEFALGVSFDLRDNESFLNDVPFSFNLGPDEGQSQVRALRFSQEWIKRQPQNIFALRSQFSIGLDIFEATTNPSGPSAEFFSWLGQVQFVQQLPLRSILVSRLNAQVTPDSLLSLEKIGTGGIGTVRGYTQNQNLTDNGVFGSVEWRVPITKAPNQLQVAPFIDVGTGWNNFEVDPDPSTLLGIGLGLRWQPISALSLRVDYGIPLIATPDQTNGLQESGVYFSLGYQPW